MRRTTVIKMVVGVAAVAVLGVLFVRSAMDVGSEPYTIPRDRLGQWTVAVDPAANATGVLLGLWPESNLAAPLFSQLFARSGLSLRGPNPAGMPLVLKSEFDQAIAGVLAPEALVTIARTAGLESAPPVPVCMATRRMSQPGSTRDVFFLRLEQPSFGAFRSQLAQALQAAGGSTGGFDPALLSPVVLLAASDEGFSTWYPLRPEATTDCLAPIVVQ